MFKVENTSRSPIALDDKGLMPGQSVLVPELSAMAQYLRTNGVVSITKVPEVLPDPKPTPAPTSSRSRSEQSGTSREE